LGADERLSTRECIGVLAVLLGLLLIVQPPAFFPAHVTLVQAPMTATLPRWVGFIMLSVGAAFQCVQNLLTRVLSRTGSEHAVSGATLLSFYMVAMGVLSISVALFVRPSRASGVPRHWAKLTVPNSAVDSALLAGVVLAGTAGQLAVAAGARTTSASKVALLAINELAFAYVFSVTVLGEPTSFLSAVGTVIVFFSSALVAAGNELDCCPHSWYGALAPL
jgi:drug/metabolite transporter (DMT)-like permease